MSRHDVVLILTQRLDPHADWVLPRLAEREVNVVRFDTADFPRLAQFGAALSGGGWSGRLVNGDGRTLDLEAVRSVWYRRPRSFEFEPAMTETERRFARGECLMALGGVLRSLDVLWVNHPEKLTSAEYKPFQLALAQRCGLSVPRSLLTNDAHAARDFYDACDGEVIYKPLSTAFVFTGAGSRVLYTTRVAASDLQDREAIARVPCLFQEVVPRGLDLRIVVIGDEVFCTAIHAPPDVLDWRSDYPSLTYSRHVLPRDVEDRLRQFVRSLDLRFSAIDMMVTPGGDHVFLEVNPNGQWVWLERATEEPMAEALVDLLSGTRGSEKTSRVGDEVVG